MPTSTDEVSQVITFANAHSLPFTVCCGGHSTAGASAAGPDGLVVDLRRMRSVSVDGAAGTVTFGGGCLWSDVDAALWPRGLATIGGTVAHTGVGGLVLGGGFGFLTPVHGLTIDVLLGVEVVLADGSVVVASETENADLFWAIRGAGTSFGVVTSFTSRVFPQGNVWAGPLVFPPTRIAEVVSAVNEVLAAHPTKAVAVPSFFYSPPPDRQPVLMVICFFNGDQAAGEAAFAPLLKLGPLAAMAKEVPYPVVNTLANEAVPHGPRYAFGAANVRFPMDAAVVQAAADVWYPGIAEMSADTALEDDFRGSFVMFEGVPNAKVREVAPGVMAFANRGEYYNVAVGMQWSNEKNDERVRDFRRKVAALIREKGFKGDETGGKGVGQYNNYIEEGISAEGAFGGNAKRLKELKAKFDPENRFDKLWRLA
jgi:FAD/FMN-containing dehydrogenase